MERNRRPPDVEEALSSMLWTPYERTPIESSDEEETRVPKHGNKSKASTVNCISGNTITTNSNDNNLFATASASAECNLFKPAIRYQSSFVSNYGRFMPKSYNSCNRQLPSYEHIEKERTFYSVATGYGIGAGPIAACATNGIYLIPSYSTCTATTTTMVHSFTDNFIEYQVSEAHCPILCHGIIAEMLKCRVCGKRDLCPLVFDHSFFECARVQFRIKGRCPVSMSAVRLKWMNPRCESRDFAAVKVLCRDYFRFVGRHGTAASDQPEHTNFLSIPLCAHSTSLWFFTSSKSAADDHTRNGHPKCAVFFHSPK